YIRGKPNGKQIWKSIQNGPTPHPMITDPPATDSAAVPAPRKKLDSEFSEEENKLEMADTQAEISQSSVGPFKQRKRSVDEYDAFGAIEKDSIHDYFVRFHKLVNDMKITQLNIPTHQMNTSLSTPSGLLGGFQKQFPPTNNQLWTSSNSKTHATVYDGQIITEPIQRKAPEEKDIVARHVIPRDVECTAPYDQPQALITTNMFQANHEDAYDSDVDEGPNAAVAFMANLSSTSATNNQVNEVHSNDNQIFDNVDYQIQEMHQEEHLDSDAETEIDDNTIPYHQYLLDTEAQNVPTEVSLNNLTKLLCIAILTDLQTQLDGHAKVNQEKCLEVETLKNELSQCKQEIYRLDTQSQH
ncbi:hypothetical protein Tco_1022510, partial [Tanacetum coccineum]